MEESQNITYSEMLNRKRNMLSTLCGSLQDDVLFLLIDWKYYWPDGIPFPEQGNIDEKRNIIREILCAMDDIELETISQEHFGVFRQVTGAVYLGFIADGVICNTGWYIHSEKWHRISQRKHGYKNSIHLMRNKYTDMGLVLLKHDWKLYMSEELSFIEAMHLYKEYSNKETMV